MQIELLRWYDIETPKGCFLISIYDGNKWEDFLIHKYRNDLLKLISFLENHKHIYWVGFNNINFDGQVIEFIWKNYSSWIDLEGDAIAAKISQFGSDVIHDTNFGGFPPYREEYLTFKQIDVFKIQHFDNKNRRVGLKRLEIEMRMEHIQSMEVDVNHENFTEKEIEDLIFYCHNDVLSTWKNYQYITGNVDNEIYKGTNQIEIREALTEKFGIDCMNFSNSKYGDEIVKILYAKELGTDVEKLPKKGTFRKILNFKNGIPEYINFKDDKLSKFLSKIRTKTIKIDEEFEEELHFDNQVHTFALGGLHNKIDSKQYHSDNDYIIIDADVTGYYPRSIINNNYYPAHLNKKAFINSYTWIVDERDNLKPLAKTDNKIKGIVAGYKEAAVSVYGKMGDITNWLYDPQGRLNICIAGELSILMLIEQQSIIGNQCIMSNTDGATFLVNKHKLKEFYDVCNKWCKITKYALEFIEFKSMWFLSVNSYLGLKMNGEIKRKNEFLIDYELHKNSSFRIIPLSLGEYLLNNIPIEDYINKNENLFEFCGRNSAKKGLFYHKGYDKKGVVSDLPEIIRYYVAKEGYNIIKHKDINNTTTRGDSNVQPADELKCIANVINSETDKEHLKNINREWYINKAKELIYKLETGKKPKSIKVDKNQISLF